MISQERLAMQGAAAVLTRETAQLRLAVKGHATVMRGQLSIYALQHLSEIDIDEFQTSSNLFVSALRELRAKEAELQEIEAGL